MDNNNINLNNFKDRSEIPFHLRKDISNRIKTIEDLKFFLVTAPIKWMPNQILRKYYLNDSLGYISCIYWDNLYYITGTDITKILIFRFEQFGRKIINKKKFEEGIFSDLRSLKVDEDCSLQMPKSEMLQFLNKNGCIKTQKKQKVFFWFSVLHDRLFADCLERDCKREFDLDLILRDLKMDPSNQTLLTKMETIKKSITTQPIFEPAISFKYKYQDLNNETLLGKSPTSRFNRTKSKNDDNVLNKNKLYEQLSMYMNSLDRVKTPSVNNVKFNFDDNIADFSTPAMSQISPTIKSDHNINPPVNINSSKINTEKTMGLAKKRKKLSLTIDVPDSNNIKLNQEKIIKIDESNVEVEYGDGVDPHLHQNNLSEPPIADVYTEDNVNKKRKLNNFPQNNSVNQEYNNYINQLVSPMGGYVNPFQMQQANHQSSNYNDKFFFNGVGFTPIRSAFPDMMTGNPYLTNNVANNVPVDNKALQDANAQYLSTFANIPLFSSVIPNIHWGFSNVPEGAFTSIPTFSSANDGMKTFSSSIGKEEGSNKEEEK